MGLSASQARLLTITARKSDCEYQSMKYSHQKISLSRDMTDISAEYQNALDATKLVYDFYGTGESTNPLSYNLMMNPSALNGYVPLMVSDNSGKIILNSKYAAAAAAAGIPQEGLGCLPSSLMRDAFIDGLATSGVISTEAAKTYKGIMYSQSIGNGTTDLATVTTQEMTLSELLDKYESGTLCDVTTYGVDIESIRDQLNEDGDPNTDNPYGIDDYLCIRTGNGSADYTDSSLSIVDLLDTNKNFQLLCQVDGEMSPNVLFVSMNIANLDIWDWMFGEFETMLSVTGDVAVQNAIIYAESMTRSLLETDIYGKNLGYELHPGFTSEQSNRYNGVVDSMNGNPGKKDDSYATSDYIGITQYWAWHPSDLAPHKTTDSGVSISITNIAKAYLTYFAQAMEGFDNSIYSVSATEGNRRVKDSVLMDVNNTKFKFDVMVDEGVNSDQALNSGFFDAIFNQICLNGWRENINIDNNEYMQGMLKTGKLLLRTMSDDGYFYASNYSTNNYIREIADEEAVAQAEAKYNTEKQKIENKEETLDLKMKNLDTEMSSLTTEYDTVKSLISKNIEKGFKRYDA